MIDLSFRPARRDEVPAILVLLRQNSLPAGDAPDILAPDRLDRHYAAFDAMQRRGNNQLIAGFDAGGLIACYQLAIIAGLSLGAPLRAQLEAVRVRADRRGQGCGAALIRDAEARARAAGCTLIQLTSNRRRSQAQRFYDRLGFTASHIGYKKSL